MRRIELVPGIQSSVIGFGCAPILGAVGRIQAERAIDVALDVGINHFDVARSYGYGRAEAMLGSVLRGKRDQVVLATKFGIMASAAAYFLSPLKPLIRALRPRRSAARTSGSSSPRPEATQSNRLASFLHKRVPLDALPPRTRRSIAEPQTVRSKNSTNEGSGFSLLKSEKMGTGNPAQLTEAGFS